MTKHRAKAMTRRNLHIPDPLWRELERYAGQLSQRRGKPVTTSEAIRRVLARAMRRRHER